MSRAALCAFKFCLYKILQQIGTCLSPVQEVELSSRRRKALCNFDITVRYSSVRLPLTDSCIEDSVGLQGWLFTLVIIPCFGYEYTVSSVHLDSYNENQFHKEGILFLLFLQWCSWITVTLVLECTRFPKKSRSFKVILDSRCYCNESGSYLYVARKK